MRQANQQRLTLGICTTSTERAANAVVKNVLADIRFDFVLAGDVVRSKKPDPEIYLLALEKSGFEPDACIVFEDSSNGVKAAKAAGMNVVATVNEYTRDEDLSLADIIVTCLGDEMGDPVELLASKREFQIEGVICLSDLIRYFEQ